MPIAIDTTTDRKIGGNVISMRQGQRLQLYGKSVECMRPMALYRLSGVSSLLTAKETIDAILRAKSALPQMSTVEIPSEPIFPETLRAMSVHAPWAYLIAKGFKTDEFRSRNIKFRGTFLIHASQTKTSDWVIEDWNLPRAEVEAMRGCIIGAGKIVGTRHIPEDDCWAHEIDDAISFVKPVPNVAGQQSQFWKATTPERIKAFNQSWIKLGEREWL